MDHANDGTMRPEARARGGRWVVFAVLMAAACGRETPFTTRDGEPNNVVLGDLHAYASLGGQGLRVVPLAGGASVDLPPPPGSDHVDDLALSGDLLFALDATAPGALSVYSLADPLAPALVSGPVAVTVGAFAGVSAADGLVVVSGGTTDLTVRTFDAAGALGAAVGAVDLGRGQPDVLVMPGGVAFASTHFETDVDGDEFGVTRLALAAPPAAPAATGAIGLDGAGFTPGVAEPANFPIVAAPFGSRVAVAMGAGLVVLESGADGSLACLARLELDLRAVSVAVDGDRAYVVGIEPSPALATIDLGSPTSPALIAIEDLPASALPTGVAARGGRVAVAAGPAGVIVR